MINFFSKLFILFFVLVSSSFALSVEEKLSNDIYEDRALKLFLQIRCLVCAGQVIENSDTQFAFDVRKLIRKKISEGLNDEEIKAYLIKKYGDEILQTPSIKSQPTLYLLPIFFFLLILTIIVRNYKKLSINNN